MKLERRRKEGGGKMKREEERRKERKGVDETAICGPSFLTSVSPAFSKHGTNTKHGVLF